MCDQKKAASLLVIILLSISMQAKIYIPVSDSKEELCQEIFNKITNEHFFYNKDFSTINSDIYDSLVEQFDSEKIYFTDYEISSFRKKFNDFDKKSRLKKKY